MTYFGRQNLGRSQSTGVGRRPYEAVSTLCFLLLTLLCQEQPGLACWSQELDSHGTAPSCKPVTYGMVRSATTLWQSWTGTYGIIESSLGLGLISELFESKPPL